MWVIQKKKNQLHTDWNYYPKPFSLLGSFVLFLIASHFHYTRLQTNCGGFKPNATKSKTTYSFNNYERLPLFKVFGIQTE